MVGPVAPANIHVDRTAPMAIDDPELDGGDVLLGRKGAPKLDTRTANERLAVEGIAPPASPGRADDFGGKAVPMTAGADANEPAAVATGASIDASATNATKRANRE